MCIRKRRLHRSAASSGTGKRFTSWVESLRESEPDIVAIPLLRERLELTGALVTIDAMDGLPTRHRPCDPGQRG